MTRPALTIADLQLTLRALGAGMSCGLSSKGWRVAIVAFDTKLQYAVAVAPDIETALEEALVSFSKQIEGRVVA